MTLLMHDPKRLARFQVGHRETLEQVYWTYVDAVTDVARRGVVFASGGQIRGVPAHDVADLVQETFTRAFSHAARQRYDGQRPYRPYLMTIARNLMADFARQRGREVPRDLDLDPLPSDTSSTVPASDTAPEPWTDPQTMARVEGYVQGLDPPLSEVYQHRFAQGRSQAETAKALGMGRQQIRTCERRIREGLAHTLGQSR